MKVLACIPARYGSTRFAGKVLAKDTGKFLIQHTYERVCLARLPDKVIIAADDERIAAAASTFGAECILTSPDHKTGTDRIAEAVKKLSIDDLRLPIESQKSKIENRKSKMELRYTLNADDIVVNLQADEPEFDPENIDYLAKLLLDNHQCRMATLVAEFENTEQVKDPNIVKVVIDKDNYAIYFSRSVIPYDRKAGNSGEIKNYLRHLGIYAYRKDFLLEITSMPQSRLEKIEKLEQLRVLDNGYSILTGRVKHTHDGIDTPEQYAKFVRRYKKSESV